ncbi:hypothetical protein Tco_1001176 [Tanacetum coccineum]
MKEKESRFCLLSKVSASGEAQEEDISPTTLEAAKTLSKVASQNVTKEKVNSAEVEVNTEVNPGSAELINGNTPVSTPSVIQTVNVIVPSLVKSQREGKAPMTSEDVQATQKTKEQIRQEEAGLAEAIRLQALQDEEDARQVHLDALLAKRIQKEQELSEKQQKRKAESLQGENVSSDDFAKRMVDMINQKKKYYAEQKARGKEENKPHDTSTSRDYDEYLIKNQSSGKVALLKSLLFEERQEAEEDMEALVKGNDTDSSSGTDIPVSVVPVAIKPPSIANWKIIKLGNKGVYQIIREKGYL